LRFVRITNGEWVARSRAPPPPLERHMKKEIPPCHRRRILTAANHRRITHCTNNTKYLPVHASMRSRGCSDGQLAGKSQHGRSRCPRTAQGAAADAATSALLSRRPHSPPRVPNGHRRRGGRTEPPRGVGRRSERRREGGFPADCRRAASSSCKPAMSALSSAWRAGDRRARAAKTPSPLLTPPPTPPPTPPSLPPPTTPPS